MKPWERRGLVLAAFYTLLVVAGAQTGLAAVDAGGAANTAVVATEVEFIAALQQATVATIRISTNLRLSPSNAWPSSAIVVNRSIIVMGGAAFPVFDCAFLERKVLLAPGATWTFKQV